MANRRRLGAVIGLGLLVALVAVAVSLAYDPTPPYAQIQAKFVGGPYVTTLMLKPGWREYGPPNLPIAKPVAPAAPGTQRPQSAAGKTLSGAAGAAMAMGSTGASDAVASPEARLEQSLKSLARSLQ